MDDALAGWQNLTPEKKAALSAFVAIGTVVGAMNAIGMARQTWYDWRKADPMFDRAVGEAEEAAADLLEARARDWAMNRTDPPAATLLIFLLKSLRPERYSDRFRHEVTGKDGGPIQHEDVTVARDRLRHRLAAWLPETG